MPVVLDVVVNDLSDILFKKKNVCMLPLNLVLM